MVGMVAALSTGLLVAALGPLAPSSVVSVGRPADGRGCHIDVRAEIDAPLEDVYAVVAEFARYGEWFPSLHSAQQMSAGEYEVQLHLPWPLKRVRERIVVAEERSAQVIVIRWRQIDGDFVRNDGTWTLHAAGPGRTVVRYENDVQFRRWVPAWLIARAERRVAPHMIESIRQRANDHARSRGLAARASR